MVKSILLALRSAETICIGPLCAGLPAASSGEAGNATALGVVGSTIGKLVNLMLIVGGLFMLFYLLWGALDWVMSEGDKEKLSKAQKKITNAIIGVILMFAALTIFGAVSGDILGIVVKTPNGWTFNLPTLTR